MTDNPPESQQTSTLELLPEPDNGPEQPDNMAQPLLTTDDPNTMELTEHTTEPNADGFVSAVSLPVLSENEDETLTDTTMSESASVPFTKPVQGRIPAKPLPVSIPVRRPTTPTLVTGSSANKNKNIREHSDSSETGEPNAKKEKH